MDNNSLFVAILILIGGLAAAVYIKQDSIFPKPEVVQPPIQQQEWIPQPKPEVKPEVKPMPTDPYLRALAEAKTSNKKVFLYFSGESCSACIKMKQTVLNDASVKHALEKFIVYEVNTSKPDGMELANKFKITLIPSYKILDGDEKILKEDTGNTRTARQFVNWLESAN